MDAADGAEMSKSKRMKIDAADGAEMSKSKRMKIDADGGRLEPQSLRRLEEVEEAEAEAAAESESCSSVSQSSSWISSGQSVLSSCCSSNGSVEAGTKCADPEGGSVPGVVVVEDETSTESDFREPIRGESGGEKMSKKGAPAAENRSDLRGGSAARMPSEAELEEFFVAAEKQVQQHFTKKYNYDVVNDVPLAEGRYEWVPLKQ